LISYVCVLLAASEPSSSGRAPPNFGGGGDQANDNDGRDYKLIIDPALGQGKDKVIRYNGCMPGRVGVKGHIIIESCERHLHSDSMDEVTKLVLW